MEIKNLTLVQRECAFQNEVSLYERTSIHNFKGACSKIFGKLPFLFLFSLADMVTFSNQYIIQGIQLAKLHLVFKQLEKKKLCHLLFVL